MRGVIVATLVTAMIVFLIVSLTSGWGWLIAALLLAVVIGRVKP